MLGPNGAGKTTTVEILEGLNDPDAGEVEVLGETWQGDGRALRARLGIQLQETKFPDKLRVSEVVALFRSFYPRGPGGGETLRHRRAAGEGGSPRAHALRRTEAAALPGLRPRGRPRAALPRRAHDRPRSAVAAPGLGHRGGLEGSRGRTVLLTTHYMEEAARLCDRVAIVDHGKVIALGTPRELVASLGAEHVVEFAVEGAADRSSARSACGRSPAWSASSAKTGRWRLTVREVHRAVPALLALLAEQGASPTAPHHAPRHPRGRVHGPDRPEPARCLSPAPSARCAADSVRHPLVELTLARVPRAGARAGGRSSGCSSSRSCSPRSWAWPSAAGRRSRCRWRWWRAPRAEARLAALGREPSWRRRSWRSDEARQGLARGRVVLVVRPTSRPSTPTTRPSPRAGPRGSRWIPRSSARPAAPTPSLPAAPRSPSRARATWTSWCPGCWA